MSGTLFDLTAPIVGTTHEDGVRIDLVLWIPCLPPTASHHQKKIRRFKIGDRLVHGLADKPALVGAKHTLEALLDPHKIARPIPGPIALDLSFVFPWRKSEPKRNVAKGRIPHTTSFDCSNLAKTLEDRLKVLRFIEDDCQVADLHVSKWWGESPGIGISIRTIR